MASSISGDSPPRVPTTSSTSETAKMSSTLDSPVLTPSTQSDPLPLRSCTFCRQRKVKCDRQKPCSNCIRANNNCSYPAGRGRAAKKSTQTLDARLVDRLQKLENIIKQLTSQVDATANCLPSSSGTDGESVSTPGGTRNNPSGVDNSAPEASIDQQLGRLMIDDSKSYYVSNILWANLGNEVSTSAVAHLSKLLSLLLFRSKNCATCYTTLCLKAMSTILSMHLGPYQRSPLLLEQALQSSDIVHSAIPFFHTTHLCTYQSLS